LWCTVETLLVEFIGRRKGEGGERETNGLGSGLRKVVGREEGSCDGSIKTCVPVVGSICDGVLETSWVFQGEMELTLFRLLGWGKSWTDVGFLDVVSRLL
jgi:hypothetical protein